MQGDTLAEESCDRIANKQFQGVYNTPSYQLKNTIYTSGYLKGVLNRNIKEK